MSNVNITVVSDIASAKMVEALMADRDLVLRNVDKSYTSDFEQRTFSPSGGSIRIPVADQPQMAKKQVALNNDPLAMREVPLSYDNYNESLEIGAINETFDAGKAVMTTTNKDRIRSLVSTMAAINYEQLNTVGGFVTAAGTALQTATDVGRFRAALANQYGGDGVFMAAAPEDMNLLAGSVSTAFNPTEVSSDAYLRGIVNRVANVSVYESTLIPTHTNGDAAGTGAAGMALAANVTSGATSIAVSGGTPNGWLTKGTILFFPGNGVTIGANEVNPMTRANLGNAFGVCVAESVQLDGAGAGVITITQALYGPEAPKYQNVSRLPTSSPTQYVQLYGAPSTTYRQAYFYRKESALAMVGLNRQELIMAQNGKASWDGIPLQTTGSHDANNLINIFRIDFLGGSCVKQYRHVRRHFTSVV